MDGPTLYRILKRASDEDFLEACHIVADLAHAGGPCPCVSLTMSTRSRAERLVGKMCELKQKLERLKALRDPKKPVIHYYPFEQHTSDQNMSAACNPNTSTDRGFKVSTDPFEVTCGACQRSFRWRQAVGIP